MKKKILKAVWKASLCVVLTAAVGVLLFSLVGAGVFLMPLLGGAFAMGKQ